MTLPTTKPNQRYIDWYIAECIDLRRQLEYEIEAKRNHLRIACEELNHLTVKTGFYERENAALRAVFQAAKAMTDYETAGAAVGWPHWDSRFDALKAAIDAARKEKT
jgi:hypothetical protein